jgi:Surfeit locus protein 6
VRDEKELKRKRDVDDDVSDVEGITRERPMEGLKTLEKKAKKQRKNLKDQTEVSNAEKGDAPVHPQTVGSVPPKQKSKIGKKSRDKSIQTKAENVGGSHGPHLTQKDTRLLEVADRVDTSPTINTDNAATDLAHTGGLETLSNPSATPTPAPESPNFDAPALPSGSSSISSIVPLTTLGKIRKPSADPVELKARLAARIEALRAARKADGLDGAPARNRQELMDARRRKEEQRKAHKRELKLKAKEEEKRDRDASIATLQEVHVKEDKLENNFSFGRVAFSDGQQLDSGLSDLLNPKKRRGPQDPFTAVKAAENKRARLDALDEEKRADIEEKDLWLSARKRAHGEKTKDDPALLKKTLKRKEKVKKKSEREWKERVEDVEKGKAIRQKKREENLRKRREEKGAKGKKKVGKKVQKRPGFEGSFSAKIKRK